LIYRVYLKLLPTNIYQLVLAKKNAFINDIIGKNKWSFRELLNTKLSPDVIYNKHVYKLNNKNKNNLNMFQNFFK